MGEGVGARLQEVVRYLWCIRVNFPDDVSVAEENLETDE